MKRFFPSGTNKIQHDKVRKNTFDFYSFAMQLSFLICSSVLSCPFPSYFQEFGLATEKKTQQAKSRGRTAAPCSTSPDRPMDSPTSSTCPGRTSLSEAPWVTAYPRACSEALDATSRFSAWQRATRFFNCIVLLNFSGALHYDALHIASL